MSKKIILILFVLVSSQATLALEIEGESAKSNSSGSGFANWARAWSEKVVQKVQVTVQNVQTSVAQIFASAPTGSAQPTTPYSTAMDKNGVVKVPMIPYAPQSGKFYTYNEMEKRQLVQQMPSFTSLMDSKTSASIHKAADEIQTYQPLLTTQKARAYSQNLDVTKSGVPYLRKEKLVRLKAISKLDIGEEEHLKMNSLQIDHWLVSEWEMKNLTALKLPDNLTEKEFIIALGEPIEKADNPDKYKILPADEKTVTLAIVEKVIYNTLASSQVTEKEYKEFTFEDLKLLRSLLLYSQGDKCHLVSGLMNDLSHSKNSEIEGIATYHLGTCSHKMGLFTDAFPRLLKTIKSANPYARGAVMTVLSEVPYEFEYEVGKTLKDYSAIDALAAKEQGLAQFYISKYLLRDKKYAEAQIAGEKVPVGHEKYLSAQYLISIAEYGLNHPDKAMQRQIKINEQLAHNKDTNLQSLVAMNLARTSFQNNDYRESVENFLKIGRDHPLWIQGLQEEAWSQLLAKDLGGAIGNMHSLQAPYFRTVYMPEAYAISAIGYLNICQYGDAYRSLTQLEKQYRPMLDSMNHFYEKNSDLEFYTTVVQHLATKSAAAVNGLSPTIIREVARHKEFLNEQMAANHRVDEAEQFGFIDGFVKKDKAKVLAQYAHSQFRISQLDAKILNAHNTKQEALVAELSSERKVEKDLLDFLKFETDFFEEGRVSLIEFRKTASSNLAQFKEKLQKQAGHILKERMHKLISQLNMILENSELLRYEVFAGSGENLRYQVTNSNQGAKRIPATVRPENKDLKWSFEGEYWEDEIGHYKSSLKNNCPES